MNARIYVLAWAMVVVTSCELSPEADLSLVSYFFDFRTDDYGWAGDFADYTATDSAALGLRFAHDNLPAELGQGRALSLSGTCPGTNLFMFLKRRITGLKPSTDYLIGFDVGFVTNAQAGVQDNGNIPGDQVTMKAGATPFEPQKLLEGPAYEMNIDKGNKITGGKDMVAIGSIESTLYAPGYSYETLTNALPFRARTSPEGDLWLIVGTETGYEGYTKLYYSHIGVVLTISE